MLANFLDKSKPINFVGLLVAFFLGFLIILFRDYFSESFSSSQLLESLVFVLFFLFIFFLANFIVAKNKLTFDNSYGFYFYIILSILILPNLLSIKVLAISLIYFLVLRKIYSLRSLKNTFEKIFDASFWLGVLFIIQPLTILFLVLVYAAIYFHKKLSINTLLIPIIGFATPLLIYFTYQFWIDDVYTFYNILTIDVSFSYSYYTENSAFIGVVCIFLFTLFCLLIKSNKALSINNTFRRSWILILINFCLAVLYLGLQESKNYDAFVFVIFPIALILANGIELINKVIFKNLILYAFLAISLYRLFLL